MAFHQKFKAQIHFQLKMSTFFLGRVGMLPCQVLQQIIKVINEVIQ